MNCSLIYRGMSIDSFTVVNKAAALKYVAKRFAPPAKGSYVIVAEDGTPYDLSELPDTNIVGNPTVFIDKTSK